jgi:hypothetical protein
MESNTEYLKQIANNLPLYQVPGLRVFWWDNEVHSSLTSLALEAKERWHELVVLGVRFNGLDKYDEINYEVLVAGRFCGITAINREDNHQDETFLVLWPEEDCEEAQAAFVERRLAV